MKYDAALFEPATRGEWTLPPQLIEARAVLARVSDALASVQEPPSPEEPLSAAVRATLAADDPSTVDLSSVLSHPQRVAEYDARVSTLRTAQQQADAELSGLLSDCYSEIIAYVRAAAEQLWSKITETVATLGDVDTTDSNTLLRSPDRVRKAWLLLEDLAAKYGRTRQAIDRLQLHAGISLEHDVQGDHGEFQAGLCTVIGPQWRPSPVSPAPRRPWPDNDPRGRLVWLVRHDLRPWWPTVSQRDQAWLACHREGYEAMQQQQQRHHLARQWASSFA